MNRPSAFELSSWPPLQDNLPRNDPARVSIELTNADLRHGSLAVRKGYETSATLAEGASVTDLGEFDDGESGHRLAVTDTGAVLPVAPTLAATLGSIGTGAIGHAAFLRRLYLADGAALWRVAVRSGALALERAGAPAKPGAAPTLEQVTQRLFKADGYTPSQWDMSEMPGAWQMTIDNATPVLGDLSVNDSGIDPVVTLASDLNRYYAQYTFASALDLRKTKRLLIRMAIPDLGPTISVGPLTTPPGHIALLSAATAKDPSDPAAGTLYADSDWEITFGYGYTGDWLTNFTAVPSAAASFPVYWEKDSADLNGVMALRWTMGGMVKWAHEHYTDPAAQIQWALYQVNALSGIPTGQVSYAWRYWDETNGNAGPLSDVTTITVAADTYVVTSTVTSALDATTATHIQLCRKDILSTEWSIVDSQPNPGVGLTVLLTDGKAPTEVLIGETFVDEAQGVAPTDPLALAAYRDRLAVLSRATLSVSTVGSEEFPLGVYAEEGGQMTWGWSTPIPASIGAGRALLAAFGRLFLFGSGGIAVYTGEGLSLQGDAVGAFKQETIHHVGLAGARSAAAGHDLLAWLASDGVYIMGPGTQMVPRRLEGINATLAGLDTADSFGHWHDGAYWLCVTADTGRVAYVYDPRALREASRGWTGPWTIPAQVLLTSELPASSGQLFAGSANAAKELRLLTGATDDGDPIMLRWRSTYIEAGPGAILTPLALALSGDAEDQCDVVGTVSCRRSDGSVRERSVILQTDGATGDRRPWVTRATEGRLALERSTALSLTIEATPAGALSIDRLSLVLAGRGRNG